MEKYKRIVEKLPDIVVVLDNYKVKYINKRGLEKFNLREGKVKEVHFFDLVADFDKETVKSSHAKEKEDVGFVYEANFIENREKNIFFRGEARVSSVELDKENFSLIVIRELEVRKKIEEVFNQQERRFRAITDNTPDMIARFDEDCRYVYVNKATEKMFQIPQKNFFWKNDEELGIKGERTPLFCEAINYVFKKKEKKEFYFEENIKQERRYFYAVLVPEFFQDGSVVSALLITRDITEIKEIDQVKSEFISITTHQLRSPLSEINWCSQSLLSEEAGEINEGQRSYLKNIQESTQKLIKITDVFLQTTILDLEMFIINPEEVDVVPFLKKIVGSFKEKIDEKKINLTEEYDKSIVLENDPRALSIIFKNMILNAIEYSPEEGLVDISLKKEEDMIVFKVGDNGCGIKEEDKNKIFAKFYRSEKARSMKAYGTGLDLYIVKELVDKMKGKVEVESPNPKFQKGCLFRVSLPVIAPRRSNFK
jgi:PAS domain S-box-containing protein